MTRRTKFRQYARYLRRMRRELVHDAGCVVCILYVRDKLLHKHLAAAVRDGVRIPRRMREALPR